MSSRRFLRSLELVLSRVSGLTARCRRGLRSFCRREPQRLRKRSRSRRFCRSGRRGVLLVDGRTQASTRDGDLGDEDVLVGGLVGLLSEVGARRAHQLKTTTARSALMRTCLGRSSSGVAEEDLCSDLAPVTLLTKVASTKQRGGKGDVLSGIPLPRTSSPGIRAAEIELELLGEVLDGRNLLEDS